MQGVENQAPVAEEDTTNMDCRAFCFVLCIANPLVHYFDSVGNDSLIFLFTLSSGDGICIQDVTQPTPSFFIYHFLSFFLSHSPTPHIA